MRRCHCLYLVGGQAETDLNRGRCGNVGTLHNHIDNIITFIKRPVTNAVGEGINRIIIVKNRSSGFRNLECFADLIFLTIGDLDIPVHIPSRLRTL